MTVRCTSLDGSDLTATAVSATDMNDTFNQLATCIGGTTASRLPPVGSIMPWHKTFLVKDSGTTSATTANKLVEAGQNFTSTVVAGMCVLNTTDHTWCYVTAVDSDTTLSVNADVMPTGKAYTIYATNALPDGWVECNGQVLSDAASIYNGETIYAVNSTTSSSRCFLYGNRTSGSTGGTDTHTHSLTAQNPGGSTTGSTKCPANTDASSTLPSYIELCFIMRVR